MTSLRYIKRVLSYLADEYLEVESHNKIYVNINHRVLLSYISQLVSFGTRGTYFITLMDRLRVDFDGRRTKGLKIIMILLLIKEVFGSWDYILFHIKVIASMQLESFHDINALQKITKRYISFFLRIVRKKFNGIYNWHRTM